MEPKELFESRLREITEALVKGDLSLTQFPRTGSEAYIELKTKQETLQWVLEMMS